MNTRIQFHIKEALFVSEKSLILPNIYYEMQELPLLTPTNFISNNKKRSRASIDDDFESHYLKKRLISTLPDLKPASTDNSKYNLLPIACKLTA